MVTNSYIALAVEVEAADVALAAVATLADRRYSWLMPIAILRRPDRED